MCQRKKFGSVNTKFFGKNITTKASLELGDGAYSTLDFTAQDTPNDVQKPETDPKTHEVIDKTAAKKKTIFKNKAKISGQKKEEMGNVEKEGARLTKPLDFIAQDTPLDTPKPATDAKKPDQILRNSKKKTIFKNKTEISGQRGHRLTAQKGRSIYAF